MEVPEHLRDELTRIQAVIAFLQTQMAALQQRQAELVFVGTGVNVSQGDWRLNPDWTLENTNGPTGK